jgi:fatty acyl-CoA reductase
MDGATMSRKVVGISGDVTMTNLGLSTADRQLLVDRVSIVFHAAATIRFDEPLKRAVLLNTRGTKYVLDLAQEMKSLEVWARSTSVSQPLRPVGELKYSPASQHAKLHVTVKVSEYMQYEQ